MMLHLRLKNSTPAQLHPEFPLKPRVEPKTERPFRIVSLPQKDGSFVASVLEAPQIVVYDRSRKAAENRAAKKYSNRAEQLAYLHYPLVTTRTVTIDMEYDDDSKTFVTYVRELHCMSTFGETEAIALDNTAEMIRGYIRSMESNHKRIPLSAAKIRELKIVVGMQ